MFGYVLGSVVSLAANVDLRNFRQLGYIFMSTIVYAMMVALGGMSPLSLFKEDNG